MSDQDEGRLLTAQEAAEYLRVSLAILRQLQEPPGGGGRGMTLEEWLAEVQRQLEEQQQQAQT